MDADGFITPRRFSRGFSAPPGSVSTVPAALSVAAPPLSVLDRGSSSGLVRLRSSPSRVAPVNFVAETALLDAAILLAASERHDMQAAAAEASLAALIAVETALEPFHLASDEYLLSEVETVALFSAYDKMPASELSSTADATAKQIGLAEALRSQTKEKIARTTQAEIDKLIRIGGIHDTFYATYASLPAGTRPDQIVNGIFVYKDKADGRETARLAADGSRLPLPDGQLSYAAVVPDEDKQFVLSMMVAHCNQRGEQLNFSTDDVVGAFPRVLRAPNSPRIFLRLPANLPHPWAGGYVEVKGALYGLKESSRLFQLEMIKVFLSANYQQVPSSPMTFISVDADDPNLKAIASLVVDDVRNLDNCPRLTQVLRDALVKRFQEITTDDCAVYAGIEHRATFINGINEVTTTQNRFIQRSAKTVGILHMPPVTTLSMQDFYLQSVSALDSTPASQDLFQMIIGYLIHALKTRHDTRPFVSFLSSQGTHPNMGDMQKAIYVLRYLFHTPHVGCVFNAMAPVFCAYSDSAYAFHQFGPSSTSFILCVGLTDAPFSCSAKPQASVAPDPVAAEYYAANSACLLICHFRQFADQLGWPQHATQLFMDSESAINLAKAPAITKTARHMKAKHHFIRELITDLEIEAVHIPAAEMRADFLTKLFPPASFLRGLSSLMNLSSVL